MIQHIAMVFDAEGLNGSEKLLLIAYCNHTDGRGYVKACVPRLADESGTSPATVKRVSAILRKRKLIKSTRRVNPRTGKPIPNLTRVNLALLASLKRAEPDYDDSLIEALTFDEDEQKTASDLLIAQSEPDPQLNLSPTRAQSEPDPGLNLSPNPYPSSVRTDPDPEESEAAHTEDTTTPPMVEVSADVLAQAAAIASRLDLARLDAKPKQVIQITQALAEALSHPAADPATLERYTAAKVTDGHTVKYVLNGLSPERLTIGLPAYRIAGNRPSEPLEDCTTHPGAARRTGGECAGCWTDRRLGMTTAPELEPAAAVEIARAKALLKELQPTGR
jgi:DNA-binding MarR family transcriptional regulator